ncbi:transcriptional regulator [Kitasatospora acidiphila]|uniref:Transcriptional regulator n=1 Tax=Kitasatospora acidiphila TaxID=2567942 RepID=A0A540VYM7_9ACTN|nr:DUF5753 domain-containing protein [Kitasatospora acidiphila]TQF01872.1 transcriptional regulator [Kitasatospora acidiphila]
MAKNSSKRGMWWQNYGEYLSDALGDLVTLEADATSIRAYEASFIPGLLQTPAYAREIITKLALQAEVNVDAIVDVRLARQGALIREIPLEVWAVIDEQAIRSGVGGQAVMAEQLTLLIERAKRPNVNIQVMPLGAPAHHGMNGAFTILGFPQRTDLDVVLIDGVHSSIWIEDARDVELYAKKFDLIRAVALGPDDSVALITEQRDKLR